MTEEYIKCEEKNPVGCGNDWERDERDPYSPFCQYHCSTCGRTWNVVDDYDKEKIDWDNGQVEEGL
tara:strand:- start:581 stop:778 length:198 start_codon:yes stop_codon:yes gene_type:complete